MKAYSLVLKLSAGVFFVVALLHVGLGPAADALLGAALPPEVLADPVLDSQNRFYGMSFAVYGVLFILGSRDVVKHGAMLRCLLWTFFAGGLARLVSMAAVGAPSVLVLGLTAVELALPPALLLWQSRLTRGAEERLQDTNP